MEKVIDNRGLRKHDTAFRLLKEKLVKLRFSKREINTMIMYIRSVNQLMTFAQNIMPETLQIRMFLRKTHTYLEDILLLTNLEVQTRKGINITPLLKRIDDIRKNKELYAFKLAITGHDIEKIFGLKGRIIGKLKEELETAIMSEKIKNTKEECINYIKKRIIKNEMWE